MKIGEEINYNITRNENKLQYNKKKNENKLQIDC